MKQILVEASERFFESEEALDYVIKMRDVSIPTGMMKINEPVSIDTILSFGLDKYTKEILPKIPAFWLCAKVFKLSFGPGDDELNLLTFSDYFSYEFFDEFLIHNNSVEDEEVNPIHITKSKEHPIGFMKRNTCYVFNGISLLFTRMNDNEQELVQVKQGSRIEHEFKRELNKVMGTPYGFQIWNALHPLGLHCLSAGFFFMEQDLYFVSISNGFYKFIAGEPIKIKKNLAKLKNFVRINNIMKGYSPDISNCMSHPLVEPDYADASAQAKPEVTEQQTEVKPDSSDKGTDSNVTTTTTECQTQNHDLTFKDIVTDTLKDVKSPKAKEELKDMINTAAAKVKAKTIVEEKEQTPEKEYDPSVLPAPPAKTNLQDSVRNVHIKPEAKKPTPPPSVASTSSPIIEDVIEEEEVSNLRSAPQFRLCQKFADCGIVFRDFNQDRENYLSDPNNRRALEVLSDLIGVYPPTEYMVSYHPFVNKIREIMLSMNIFLDEEAEEDFIFEVECLRDDLVVKELQELNPGTVQIFTKDAQEIGKEAFYQSDQHKKIIAEFEKQSAECPREHKTGYLKRFLEWENKFISESEAEFPQLGGLPPMPLWHDIFNDNEYFKQFNKHRTQRQNIVPNKKTVQKKKEKTVAEKPTVAKKQEKQKTPEIIEKPIEKPKEKTPVPEPEPEVAAPPSDFSSNKSEAWAEDPMREILLNKPENKEPAPSTSTVNSTWTVNSTNEQVKTLTNKQISTLDNERVFTKPKDVVDTACWYKDELYGFNVNLTNKKLKGPIKCVKIDKRGRCKNVSMKGKDYEWYENIFANAILISRESDEQSLGADIKTELRHRRERLCCYYCENYHFFTSMTQCNNCDNVTCVWGENYEFGIIEVCHNDRESWTCDKCQTKKVDDDKTPVNSEDEDDEEEHVDKDKTPEPEMPQEEEPQPEEPEPDVDQEKPKRKPFGMTQAQWEMKLKREQVIKDVAKAKAQRADENEKMNDVKFMKLGRFKPVQLKDDQAWKNYDPSEYTSDDGFFRILNHTDKQECYELLNYKQARKYIFTCKRHMKDKRNKGKQQLPKNSGTTAIDQKKANEFIFNNANEYPSTDSTELAGVLASLTGKRVLSHQQLSSEFHENGGFKIDEPFMLTYLYNGYTETSGNREEFSHLVVYNVQINSDIATIYEYSDKKYGIPKGLVSVIARARNVIKLTYRQIPTHQRTSVSCVFDTVMTAVNGNSKHQRNMNRLCKNLVGDCLYRLNDDEKIRCSPLRYSYVDVEQPDGTFKEIASSKPDRNTVVRCEFYESKTLEEVEDFPTVYKERIVDVDGVRDHITRSKAERKKGKEHWTDAVSDELEERLESLPTYMARTICAQPGRGKTYCMTKDIEHKILNGKVVKVLSWNRSGQRELYSAINPGRGIDKSRFVVDCFHAFTKRLSQEEKAYRESVTHVYVDECFAFETGFREAMYMLYPNAIFTEIGDMMQTVKWSEVPSYIDYIMPGTVRNIDRQACALMNASPFGRLIYKGKCKPRLDMIESIQKANPHRPALKPVIYREVVGKNDDFKDIYRKFKSSEACNLMVFSSREQDALHALIDKENKEKTPDERTELKRKVITYSQCQGITNKHSFIVITDKFNRNYLERKITDTQWISWWGFVITVLTRSKVQNTLYTTSTKICDLVEFKKNVGRALVNTVNAQVNSMKTQLPMVKEHEEIVLDKRLNYRHYNPDYVATYEQFGGSMKLFHQQLLIGDKTPRGKAKHGKHKLSIPRIYSMDAYSPYINDNLDICIDNFDQIDYDVQMESGVKPSEVLDVTGSTRDQQRFIAYEWMESLVNFYDSHSTSMFKVNESVSGYSVLSKIRTNSSFKSNIELAAEKDKTGRLQKTVALFDARANNPIVATHSTSIIDHLNMVFARVAGIPYLTQMEKRDFVIDGHVMSNQLAMLTQADSYLHQMFDVNLLKALAADMSDLVTAALPSAYQSADQKRPKHRTLDEFDYEKYMVDNTSCKRGYFKQTLEQKLQARANFGPDPDKKLTKATQNINPVPFCKTVVQSTKGKVLIQMLFHCLTKGFNMIVSEGVSPDQERLMIERAIVNTMRDNNTGKDITLQCADFTAYDSQYRTMVVNAFCKFLNNCGVPVEFTEPMITDAKRTMMFSAEKGFQCLNNTGQNNSGNGMTFPLNTMYNALFAVLGGVCFSDNPSNPFVNLDYKENDDGTEENSITYLVKGDDSMCISHAARIDKVNNQAAKEGWGIKIKDEGNSKAFAICEYINYLCMCSGQDHKTTSKSGYCKSTAVVLPALGRRIKALYNSYKLPHSVVYKKWVHSYRVSDKLLDMPHYTHTVKGQELYVYRAVDIIKFAAELYNGDSRSLDKFFREYKEIFPWDTEYCKQFELDIKIKGMRPSVICYSNYVSPDSHFFPRGQSVTICNKISAEKISRPTTGKTAGCMLSRLKLIKFGGIIRKETTCHSNFMDAMNEPMYDGLKGKQDVLQMDIATRDYKYAVSRLNIVDGSITPLALYIAYKRSMSEVLNIVRPCDVASLKYMNGMYYGKKFGLDFDGGEKLGEILVNAVYGFLLSGPKDLNYSERQKVQISIINKQAAIRNKVWDDDKMSDMNVTESYVRLVYENYQLKSPLDVPARMSVTKGGMPVRHGMQAPTIGQTPHYVVSNEVMRRRSDRALDRYRLSRKRRAFGILDHWADDFEMIYGNRNDTSKMNLAAMNNVLYTETTMNTANKKIMFRRVGVDQSKQRRQQGVVSKPIRFLRDSTLKEKFNKTPGIVWRADRYATTMA